MATKHYVLGAGMVGCLYDYGPNAHETLESALEDAAWYTGDVWAESNEPTLARAIAEMRRDLLPTLRDGGAYYFPAALRSVLGDYLEVSEQDGPCPEQDD
jgi:hypothetical protein